MILLSVTHPVSNTERAVRRRPKARGGGNAAFCATERRGDQARMRAPESEATPVATRTRGSGALADQLDDGAADHAAIGDAGDGLGRPGVEMPKPTTTGRRRRRGCGRPGATSAALAAGPPVMPVTET